MRKGLAAAPLLLGLVAGPLLSACMLPGGELSSGGPWGVCGDMNALRR